MLLLKEMFLLKHFLNHTLTVNVKKVYNNVPIKTMLLLRYYKTLTLKKVVSEPYKRGIGTQNV